MTRFAPTFEGFVKPEILLWNNGYLWNQSDTAAPTNTTAINMWVDQE